MTLDQTGKGKSCQGADISRISRHIDQAEDVLVKSSCCYPHMSSSLPNVKHFLWYTGCQQMAQDTVLFTPVHTLPMIIFDCPCLCLC